MKYQRHMSVGIAGSLIIWNFDSMKETGLWIQLVLLLSGAMMVSGKPVC